MWLVPALWCLFPGCVRQTAREDGKTVAPAGVTRPSNIVFENVIADSGIDFQIKQTKSPLNILETTGEGVGLIDADGDGLLDIVFIGPNQVRLYKNLGGMHFKDVTPESGLQQQGIWSGVAVGDYDNDGRPDIYLCGYNCGVLYHNEGNFHFKPVDDPTLRIHPPAPGKSPEWRTACGFVDIDNDGHLDLVVGRYATFGPDTAQLCGDPSKPLKYTCAPDIYAAQKPSVYRNDGHGRFTDVTVSSGLSTASGRSLGIAFGDFNDDGKTDIAIANDEMPGDLFQNLGGGRFINVGTRSGTALSAMGKVHGGMGIDWGDYDGDGKLDLFVATYQNEAKNLYHNLGKGMFMDSALDSGLSEQMDRYVSFGAKFLDYDRDGWLDLIVTNGHVLDNTSILYPGTNTRQPIQLFHNRGGSFEETTAQLSENARMPIVGRGLAVGDLDNDGRPDVVIVDHDGRPVLLHNVLDNANHWITFKLVGTRSNRDGFGTRVTIRAGDRIQLRDATNAGSFLSMNDPRVNFGLGSAARVASIQVRWPSGLRQEFKDLAADRQYEIKEGVAQPVEQHLPH
jgi:hypothetical protein